MLKLPGYAVRTRLHRDHPATLMSPGEAGISQQATLSQLHRVHPVTPDCGPVTRAGDPPEAPVSRPFPRPGVPPGWSPFPVVSAFLLPTGRPAQGFTSRILMIFLLST